MTYAAFRSIGSYIPEEIRDNDWFVQRMDTSDEWITKRTGISQRRIAASDEQTSDMGMKAAKLAIQRANIQTNDLNRHQNNFLLMNFILNGFLSLFSN